MRTFGLVFALVAAASCNPHGSCCNDGDCWGSFVCSEECTVNGGRRGVCLQRCQVDLDCGGGVCDDLHQECACEPAGDAGAAGTCPQGANG